MSAARPSNREEVASASESCARRFEAELDYVYRTLHRLGVPPGETDDLAQEVFLVMCRRWRDFQRDRPLRPWLAGIARYVALHHLRRRRPVDDAADVQQLHDPAPGPDEQLAAAHARTLVLRALGSLPSHHREILIQHDLDGVSIQEIAQGSAMPLFTAYSRLRRARLSFASTIERLQRAPVTSGAMRGGILLSPEALLAIERAVPALPAPVRRRMVDWLHSPAAAALGSNAASSPAAGSAGLRVPAPRAPSPASLGLVAVLAAGAAVVASIVLLRRPADPPPPAAPPAIRPSAGARVPSPTRRAPPTFATAPANRALAMLPATAPLQASGALDRGLTAHWRLDDGRGATMARDVSGNDRDCRIHGVDPAAAWTLGAVGGGLELGGSGWLECPVPDARAGVPLELSVSIWLKPPHRPTAKGTVLARQLPTGDGKNLLLVELERGRLCVSSEAWTGWACAANRSRFDGGWVHVAFTHDLRTTTLYFDGVAVRRHVGSRPRGEGLVTSTLTIGAARFHRDARLVRRHLNAAVDDVRIYDRLLTDTEVAALAQR